MALIRHATEDDFADIAALWNEYVDNTTATFRPDRYTHNDIAALVATACDNDHGFFIAANEGFLGFGLYRQFRGGAGYARTMEHSIYLADAARGRGIGRALMQKLVEYAQARKVHSFIGGITADNHGSIAFHRRMGFRTVAEIPQSGWKFDRWHDLILMQKFLNETP